MPLVFRLESGQKKIGDTEYALNLIPVGGYVRLLGEEGTDENENNPKSLVSKTPLQQFFVFVAGVLMNLVLAILIFWLVFSIGTQPILSGDYNYKGLVDSRKVIITEVEKGTPAEMSGLKSGDQILAVDGKSVRQSQEVINMIQEKVSIDGAKVDLTVRTESKTEVKTLSTYKSKIQSNGKEIEVNRVGIQPRTEGEVKANPFNAFFIAIAETFRIAKVTLVGIVDLFKLIFTHFKLSEDVTGPIGIVIATGFFAKMGITYLLQFVAAISISLAVFNILPIPALDGGAIFFTFLETVARRKFSPAVKNTIQLVGFALLILLILAVVVKDVVSFNIIGFFQNLFK